jgi:hypothetical protein
MANLFSDHELPFDVWHNKLTTTPFYVIMYGILRGLDDLIVEPLASLVRISFVK